MPRDNIQFRVPDELKSLFKKNLLIFGFIRTTTQFFQDCMKALIQQVRSGDKVVYPLEFVTQDDVTLREAEKLRKRGQSDLSVMLNEEPKSEAKGRK